jgi:Ala-tRNA(Pro) deacylase
MQGSGIRHNYLTADRFLPGYTKEIPSRLICCLNDSGARYQVLHEPDCPEKIQRSSPARGFVHSAVVRAGNRRWLAVHPSDREMDLKKFARLLGESVRLETENEFKWLFPDCALGAIPPFGNLYGLLTWADRSLAGTEEIVFSAGTQIDAIRLAYSAFVEIVKPKIGDFTIRSSSTRFN